MENVSLSPPTRTHSPSRPCLLVCVTSLYLLLNLHLKHFTKYHLFPWREKAFVVSLCASCLCSINPWNTLIAICKVCRSKSELFRNYYGRTGRSAQHLSDRLYPPLQHHPTWQHWAVWWNEGWKWKHSIIAVGLKHVTLDTGLCALEL